MKWRPWPAGNSSLVTSCFHYIIPIEGGSIPRNNHKNARARGAPMKLYAQVATPMETMIQNDSMFIEEITAYLCSVDACNTELNAWFACAHIRSPVDVSKFWHNNAFGCVCELELAHNGLHLENFQLCKCFYPKHLSPQKCFEVGRSEFRLSLRVRYFGLDFRRNFSICWPL